MLANALFPHKLHFIHDIFIIYKTTNPKMSKAEQYVYEILKGQAQSLKSSDAPEIIAAALAWEKRLELVKKLAELGPVEKLLKWAIVMQTRPDDEGN